MVSFNTNTQPLMAAIPADKEKVSKGFTTKQKILMATAAVILTIGAVVLYNRFYGAATPMPETNPNAENLCLTVGRLKDFCAQNLGIYRKNMPQIEGTMKDLFIDKLSKLNVSVTKVSLPADQLLATQSEISGKIVRGMVKSYFENTFAPCKREIIIANDKHIIDGHHTAYACAWLKVKLAP